MVFILTRDLLLRSLTRYSSALSFPAAQVYLAAATKTLEVALVKEQDLVLDAGPTGKVGSWTVRYSDLALLATDS
jgi:hypothetical protein